MFISILRQPHTRMIKSQCLSEEHGIIEKRPDRRKCAIVRAESWCKHTRPTTFGHIILQKDFYTNIAYRINLYKYISIEYKLLSVWL